MHYPFQRPAFFSISISLASLALAMTWFLTNSNHPALAVTPQEEPQLEKEVTSDTDASTEADSLPCDDWEKPQFALFITGRQHGYIEPCGCTGLAQAKGGLSRRASLLRHLRAKGWDIVPVDVGNQVRRLGPQPAIKFQTTSSLLRSMGYAGVSFGPDDLKISATELAYAIAGEGGPIPFVSANVDVLGLNPKFKIAEVGDRRIGITAVVGKGTAKQATSKDGDITVTDPAQALKPVVAELQKAKCDKLVLLAHCSLEETEALVKQYPMFDIVVTAGGAGEPTVEPATVDGSDAKIIQAGTKGIYVGVVGFYGDHVKYDRIELAHSIGESPKVLEAFALYQQQLRDAGFEGLGLRPVRHPKSSKENPRTFVGHEACGDCHTTAFEIFENSPHFGTTKSIAEPTERSNIKRHHDPECISCHVTGWNPQEHFPYVSGYLDLEKSKPLHSIGCESCHGPGSAHVAAENGDVDVTEDQLVQLQEEMRLTLDEAKNGKCYDCHDSDNSPEFDFDTYWPEIEHEGKD